MQYTHPEFFTRTVCSTLIGSTINGAVLWNKPNVVMINACASLFIGTYANTGTSNYVNNIYTISN